MNKASTTVIIVVKNDKTQFLSPLLYIDYSGKISYFD